MNKFKIILAPFILALLSFAAHGKTCSGLLVNSLDTSGKPFNGPETKAIREAKFLLSQGLDSYATKSLEEKYEAALADENSKGIEASEAVFLAKIYFDQKNFKAAIRVLTFTLINLKFEKKLDRTYTMKKLANAHKKAALAFEDFKHLEQEVEIRKLLVEATPYDSLNRRDLVQALIALERHHEAIIEIKALIPMARNEGMNKVLSKAMSDLRILFDKIGDHRGSELILREILKIHPNSSNAIDGLVKNLTVQRKYSELRSFIEEVYEKDLDGYPPAFILAAVNMYSRSEKWSEVDHLISASKKYPGLEERVLSIKERAMERNYDPDFED